MHPRLLINFFLRGLGGCDSLEKKHKLYKLLSIQKHQKSTYFHNLIFINLYIYIKNHTILKLSPSFFSQISVLLFAIISALLPNS